jgi:hypothetical protein
MEYLISFGSFFCGKMKNTKPQEQQNSQAAKW